jgi:repressor LexA
VLDFIVSYIERHGYEPSYQLIARHLGVRSKAGIAKHVEALEEQGLLLRKRVNGSFRIEIVRSNGAGGDGAEVEWLLNGSDEREEWELKPFAVPEFMLVGHPPSAMLAFRVPDNSMSGRNICEGDVVLIERRSHCRDGDCIVVSVRGKETILRVFYRDGAKVELRAANEEFEVMRLGGDQVEVHGVFRGLLRFGN